MPILNENLARASRNIFDPRQAIRTPDFNPNPGLNPNITFQPPVQQQEEAPLFPVLPQSLPQSAPAPGPEQNDLYKPDTRATDEFMRLIQNIPQREEPGLGRRVLGGLAHLGPEGAQGAERIMYGPYQRQLGDFKIKADLLKDLSAAERSGNVNERMLAGQILRDEQATKRAEITARGVTEREKAGEAKRKFDQIRIDLARIREDKTLSDAEKAKLVAGYAQDLEGLRQEGRLESIGARGELETGLEKLRQEGRIEIEEKRTAGDISIEREKSDLKGEAAKKEELPTQTKVRQFNIAREIYNSDPDAKNFIKFTGANDFNVKMPSAWKEATKQQYKAKYEEIYRKIYGTAPPAETTVTTPPKSTPTATTTGGVDTYVRDPISKKLVKKTAP